MGYIVYYLYFLMIMVCKYWGLYNFGDKVYSLESLWLWIIETTSGIKDYYVSGVMGMNDHV